MHFRRKEKSNWKASDSANKRGDEVAAYLKQHEGEARVWQTTPETWLPLFDKEIQGSGESGIGSDYNGTLVERSSAARGAAFRERDIGELSDVRDVVDFGDYYKVDQTRGGPDLDSAVSTLVVRLLPCSDPTAPGYWFRKVEVLTLAEAFFWFRYADSFKNIYTAWVEGRVVFYKRSARGSSGSGTNAGNSDCKKGGGKGKKMIGKRKAWAREW